MSTAASSLPIIVGVDGSPASRVAVDWAARDAALRGADLKLVHVLVPPAVMAFPEVPMPPGFMEWQDEEGRRLLDGAVKTVEEAGAQVEVSTDMVSGPAVPVLADLSSSAQMIVVGCRGHGALARGLLGSVSTGLAHHAQRGGKTEIAHQSSTKAGHQAGDKPQGEAGVHGERVCGTIRAFQTGCPGCAESPRGSA
jgi:nucleotide-binding universal stress UspA family protein